ncbi:MAG TPA: GntR family transcriptional regulator, partial [Thermosynergistes sp.]|nr:GntR family transcriptional regulator [Thermosynergistes sp.]
YIPIVWWLYTSGARPVMREKTKKDLAYEEIKRLILDGKLSGDMPVSENVLANMLDISRTPVRDALRRLEMDGFVRVIPNQGVVIREVSISEVKEIYDMRIALEEFVVRELADGLSDEDFRNLEAILKKQEEACEKRDAVAFHEEDRKFHDYLMRAYGNAMITNFIATLRDRIEGINVNMLKTPGNMQLFYGEHKRIFEALRKRSGEEAAKEMDKHLKGGKTRLIAS